MLPILRITPSIMILIASAGGTGGCGLALANLTASLGGSRAGQRGRIGAVFINNTAYRAIATFGTYDQYDERHVPDFDQFGPNDGGPILDAGKSSDIISISCGRVFAIGSPGLLALIDAHGDTSTLATDALVAGVVFVDAGAAIAASTAPSPGGIDAAGKSATSAAQDVAGLPRVGNAAPFEARIGVDFPCGALLILHLEENGAGGTEFRIDFSLIAAESTR